MKKTRVKRMLQAAAACAALYLALVAQASAHVVVSPEAGTPDASPQTEISFLGARGGDLGPVGVVGSRSGAHSGRLVAYASARGVSFVPDRPFVGGDRVTVRAPRAHLRWTFTVIATAKVNVPIQTVSAAASNRGGVWSFQSSPVHPPSVRVTRNARGASSGDVFVAPIRAPTNVPGAFVGQAGPLILDAAGNPIWSRPMARHVWAMNFQPQTYLGQPVLTWWQGNVSGQGIGQRGQDVILDSNYNTVAVISSVNGYTPDLHEFLITPSGAALVTAYRAIRKDVSAYHGSHNGQLWDSVVQEVDLRTGRVMFEWHPLQHVSLRETYTTPVSGMVWDPYHVNAVDIDAAGNLLVTMRNTWSIYYVRASDGKTLWRLGGKRSTFRMGRGAAFAWEHDGRFLPGGTIGMFDDEATPEVRHLSRGLILRLDTKRRTATVAHQYIHRGVLAGSQGNQQVLANGNVFEGWGSAPYFSEFTHSGRVLYDAHFHGADESYRAFRGGWVGHPQTTPALAVHNRVGYASWNGATEVASWRLFAGPDPGHLAPAGGSGRTGFETAIGSSSAGPWYMVQALDGAGRVLGSSPPVKG